jgi:hypothetical protein
MLSSLRFSSASKWRRQTVTRYQLSVSIITLKMNLSRDVLSNKNVSSAAHKYRLNNTTYRILSKIHGLRFVVSITGTSGKFNALRLFLAIGRIRSTIVIDDGRFFLLTGSGIGYMVIAGLVCDFIMMHVHKSRDRYRAGKVSLVDDIVLR